jgi:hypothetical protein
MRKHHEQLIKAGEGFLVVYAIDDRHSFDQVEEFVNRITDLKGPNVPLVLGGLKLDLQAHRAVSSEEGASKAKRLQFGAFYEISSKQRIYVEESFYDLVRLIRRRRNKEVLRTDFRPFCKAALLTFLMIQKRAKKGGVEPLGKIPSDVLLMISKMIFASRRDGNVWGVVLKKDGGGGKKCVVQ